MNNMFRINREEAALVLIDFQERLMPAMADKEILEDKVCRMVQGAKALNLPIILTQQYTKGLGPTIASIRDIIGDAEYIEKNTFSAYLEENFKSAVKNTNKKTILLAGIETHICVEQTALDLVTAGYDVVLISDCTQSRDSTNKEIAIRRMTNSGVGVTSYESALYEMLVGSKAEEFKAISNIVK